MGVWLCKERIHSKRWTFSFLRSFLSCLQKAYYSSALKGWLGRVKSVISRVRRWAYGSSPRPRRLRSSPRSLPYPPALHCGLSRIRKFFPFQARREECTLISLNSGCLSVSFRNRTAERRGQQKAWVWQTWRDHYLPVFSGVHLTLMFFFFYKKICLKECEVWGKVFSNTIIVTLATQGLLSTFPSCYVSSLLTD